MSASTPTVICVKRLSAELRDAERDTGSGVKVFPLNNKITEWLFVFKGAIKSPLEGGEFIGKITFPDDYPNKAPSIEMITPNGVFEPGQKICMSMTHFHPESWIPSWKGVTIIIALQSFMAEMAKPDGAAYPGRVAKYDEEECKKLTRASHEWNEANRESFMGTK